ncbi:MAG: ParB N-terminal domain-containing protein [Candidatus Kerfeldbacteria bacterium]|nr:ParB N-terminal domain-containing protein [Candidatus Kerfeldbacteria bacterium]
MLSSVVSGVTNGTSVQKRMILDAVCSNSTLKRRKVAFSLKNPFRLIADAGSSSTWCAKRGSNPKNFPVFWLVSKSYPHIIFFNRGSHFCFAVVFVYIKAFWPILFLYLTPREQGNKVMDHYFCRKFSMKNFIPEFKDIPIDQIREDINQPREELGTDGDNNPLRMSIKAMGTGSPILVLEEEKNKYKIMDGHRRFRVSKALGHTSVWCRVYPQELSRGDFELMRYHVQNVRRTWKPLERAESLVQIKDARRLKTLKELAQCVNLSESAVQQTMKLRNQKLEHLALMEHYKLPPAYRNEFVRLKDKLCRIREFEIDQIIHNLFDRVQRKVIKSAKEFRRLGSIFRRATSNEQAIYEFLSDSDMTVSELERCSSTSGFSLLIENMIEQVAGKRSGGVVLSEREEQGLEQLYGLLKTAHDE